MIKTEKIKMFENAAENVDRRLLLEVAKHLSIYHKKGASVFIDEYMNLNAGKNKNPKIIDISKTIDNFCDLNDLRTMVIKYAKICYSGKAVVIKDTNIVVHLDIRGIKKTFSGRTVHDKLQSVNKLEDIIREGIYFNTSYNENDKTGIIFHHFLTPVKLYNKSENAFIRTVIKEYTKDQTMINKFYYHQFEYIDNKKRNYQLKPYRYLRFG